MPRLSPLHWRDVERVLLLLNYEQNRSRGSHQVYVKSGELRHVTLKKSRKDIPVGTLKSIIKQIGISREEFLQLLNQVKN